MKRIGLLVITIAVLFLCGTAHATTWYVHPDSTLNSIQAGIDLCSTGDTVLVGSGAYVENINFNGMAITVTSEYGPDFTIIDGGTPTNPDSASVVTFVSGEDTTSVLQGFTITNGNGTNVPGYGTMGGGILCRYLSSPTIIGNRITENAAFWGGGGIAILLSSSPIINSNIISNNVADTAGGGILVFNYSDATIIDNTIMFNTTVYGGGIYVVGAGSDPTIMNNEIVENTAFGSGGYGSGAGLAIAWSAAPTVHGNNITNNTANYSGGGVYCTMYSAPLFIGNTITDNTSSHGAIRCMGDATPIFKFCNISGNNAAGASVLQCSPTFDSCTISNNQYNGIMCFGSVDAVINWCNIYGHASYGVYNSSASDTIDATNNWWGDPSGPGGFGPGTGDPVTDYVDFDPWLTDSVQWVGIEEHKVSQPVTTSLQINPNPFRDRVNIAFNIEHGAKSIELKIYDATGRLVKSFRPTPNAQRLTQISWDGTDQANRQLPSGVYFVKFQAGGYTETKKLLLIK